MRQLIDIKIHQDIPGEYHAYLVDARFIDDKTPLTRFGYEWDKGISMSGTYLGPLLTRLGNRITEILCGDNL